MEFEDDILETALKRRSALAALAEGPLHRRELQEELEVSKTTCHRIVRSFNEKRLLQRTDQGYGLTPLGRFLEQQVDQFDTTVRTAFRLEPLLTAFEAADVPFDPELFEDAKITEPRTDDPSPPINRYLELFREADRVRTIDRTSFIPPLYVEEIFELSFAKGRTGIAIYPRSVVERRFAEHPDIHRKALKQRDGPIYRVHDDIPFGMTIYDTDHVALRAYDDDTGALLLLVDTDDARALQWAENVYETYYEQSEPSSVIEDLPDWVPESTQ